MFGVGLFAFGQGLAAEVALDFVEAGKVFRFGGGIARGLVESEVEQVFRGLSERVGGFAETIQDMYEDQVFLARLCLAAPVFVTGMCGDWYRQHPSSSSNQAIQAGEYHPTRPNPARYAFLTWLATYLEHQGIRDAAVWKALRVGAQGGGDCSELVSR